jgi:hypothetical protein
MTAADLNYRGYRLAVRAQGQGWKVTIYAPGSVFGEDQISQTDDPAGRDQVIAEAQGIVDRLLRSERGSEG